MSSRPDFNITEELKKLPATPGVYLMHNDADEIIYVGKAISLKNRVKQYFETSRSKTTKILKMVSQIKWFEYIITDSEREALVLECNLIKEHHPRYNTMLMDDKGYPFICVTVQEDFPRVFIARKVVKNGARYFGPYTSGFAVKKTLELLQSSTQLRTCTRVLPRDIRKQRPCLNCDMHKCLAPCTGEVTKEQYAENVNRVVSFLEGDYKPVLSDLKARMKQASDALNYEEALKLRDIYRSVEHFEAQQKITDLESDTSRDVIAFAGDGTDGIASVFFVRGGQLLGRDHFHLTIGEEETPGEILSAFAKQFYLGTSDIPDEVLLQTEIEDADALSDFLTEKKHKKVAILVPKRGQKEHFLVLAEKNAKIMLDREKGTFLGQEKAGKAAMEALESVTGLSDVHRIEAYDISNISGFESVGSMVVFTDGVMRKHDYRKFRIRSVSGPDDYKSLEEVLTRRFSEKNVELCGLPDLILMDGGKGQVHAAESVLRGYGISIPVIGMVKDDSHRTRGLYINDEEVEMDTHGEAFHFVTRIQDEVHRFAITYHSGLHEKVTVKSVLSEIPGVGKKRETELIRAFTDIDALRAADIGTIARVPSFNTHVAEQVYYYLHPKKEGEN